MKVSCLWHGGYGYTSPTIEDIEHFDSLKEAKQTFINRYNNADLSTPCVSDNTDMWVYVGICDNMENGPDYIISLGKRGGIRIQRG